MLGIPDHSRCCLVRLDGVLTQAAVVRVAGWQGMFDDFPRRWGKRTGQRDAPFGPAADYDRCANGKPRAGQPAPDAYLDTP